MYLTYSEYSAMGGTRTRAVFDRYETKASNLITSLTHSRIANESPVRAAVRYAAFDLITAMMDDSESGADKREIASMSNDGVSVTYVQNTTSPRTRYTGILRGYLEAETDANGTPLLYMGVDA